MTMLAVKGLGRRFGGVAAVTDVSFSVERGEVVGLMGPNGAGKTTLFAMLAGAIRPSSGHMYFQGEEVTGWSAQQAASAGVVRTDQNTRPFERMTALDNVIVGTLLHSRSLADCRREARRLLASVGLADREERLAGELSTGQRKRLEVARAMATQPKLLLLDEMTGGVDQRTVQSLLELVRWLKDSGMTLILIEHNQEAMMALASRVIAMNLSRVIDDGPPASIVQSQAVIDAYLGPGPAAASNQPVKAPTE